MEETTKNIHTFDKDPFENIWKYVVEEINPYISLVVDRHVPYNTQNTLWRMFFIVSSEYETNGGDISEIIKRIDKELKISTDYVSDNNETFRYGYRIYEPMEYKIFKKNVKEAGYKFPPPHSETFLPHLNPVSKIIVTELVAILKEKRKDIK